MAYWLRAGTISVTQGSADIAGSDTAWQQLDRKPRPGNLIVITDIAGNQWVYEVASCGSDTTLTLAEPFAGASGTGLGYAIDCFAGNTNADLSERISAVLSAYEALVGQILPESTRILTEASASALQAQQSSDDSAVSAAKSENSASQAHVSQSSAEAASADARVAAALAQSVTGLRVAANCQLRGMVTGDAVFSFICDADVAIPHNLAGSRFRLRDPAISNATFTVHANQTPVATLFCAEGDTAFISTPLVNGDTSLAAGGEISITLGYANRARALILTLILQGGI